MAYGFKCPNCGSKGPHASVGEDHFECSTCHDEFTLRDDDYARSDGSPWPHATNKEQPHDDDKETPHA